jgi:hypothetical protein
MFRETLEELKDRFIERLSVFHMISREEQDIPILQRPARWREGEGAAALAGAGERASIMSSSAARPA